MGDRGIHNKGFSLVELIIVIAIMAILIGVLTPMYVKNIRQSQITADAANADEIALAINVAITDPTDKVINGTPAAGIITYVKDTPIITDAAGNALVVAPASEVQENYQWYIYYNAEGTGVAEIRLGTDSGTAVQIWPSSAAYRVAN